MTAASASDRDDDSSDTNVLNQRTHSCGSPLLGPATTLEDDDWSVAVAAKDSEEVGGGGGGGLLAALPTSRQCFSRGGPRILLSSDD